MISKEPKLYYHKPNSNPSNADATSYADGWPVSVRVVQGDYMDVIPEVAEVEGYTPDYEYPDAEVDYVYETFAEIDARRQDAPSIAHNAAKKAAEDAIPTWALTRRQLRLALDGMGVTTAMITAAVNAEGVPESVRIYWEDTNDFIFDNVLVLQFAAVLGIDEATRTAIWYAAKDL